MAEFTTEPLELDDMEVLRHWISMEDVFRNLYILCRPYSLDELEDWYYGEKEGGAHMFKYIDREGNVTGIGILHYLHEKNRNGEISVIVNPYFFRQGFGRAIVTHLLDFSFGKMNLHKVFLHVVEYNEAMLMLLKNFGFTKEGVFRKELFFGRTYHDILRFGLFEEEYFEKIEKMKH